MVRYEPSFYTVLIGDYIHQISNQMLSPSSFITLIIFSDFLPGESPFVNHRLD